MENLKEWAAIICSVAVGSVFTVFLVPDGKMKKQAETVISLVFLFLVVSFVTDIKPSELVKFPEFDDDIMFDTEAYISEDVKKYTEGFIRAEIQDICKGEYSVIADVHSSDNVFTVSSVRIVIEACDLANIPAIKNKVVNAAGLIPEVVQSE